MVQRRKIPIQTIRNTSNFCIYCWGFLQEWEKIIDHFDPYCSSLNNSKYNLFVSCRECNSIKSDKSFLTLVEARKYILEIKQDKWVPIKKKKKTKCRKEMICKNCWKEYLWLSYSKFCTTRCNNNYHYEKKDVILKKFNKTCDTCKGKFETHSHNQRFCWEECKNKQHTNKCLNCKAIFTSYVKKKFCTTDCRIYSLNKLNNEK